MPNCWRWHLSGMAKADFAAFVPAESFYKEFGITQDSLDKTDEVDIG